MDQKPPRFREANGGSLSGIAAELASSLRDILRAEVHLARAEVTDITGQLSKHVVQAALFGAVAALGILPILAFAVIGLGRLLDENYWRGALIVGVGFMAVGGGLAFSAYRKLLHEDLSFPHTRRGFQQQVAVTEKKLDEVAQTTKGRVA